MDDYLAVDRAERSGIEQEITNVEAEMKELVPTIRWLWDEYKPKMETDPFAAYEFMFLDTVVKYRELGDQKESLERQIREINFCEEKGKYYE